MNITFSVFFFLQNIEDVTHEATFQKWDKQVFNNNSYIGKMKQWQHRTQIKSILELTGLDE